MTQNVGKIDKTIRFVIALSLLIIGLVADLGVGLKIVVFVFAAIALGTGLFGL